MEINSSHDSSSPPGESILYKRLQGPTKKTNAAGALDSNGALHLLEVDDFVHQQKGISMGQNLRNLDVVLGRERLRC